MASSREHWSEGGVPPQIFFQSLLNRVQQRGPDPGIAVPFWSGAVPAFLHGISFWCFWFHFPFAISFSKSQTYSMAEVGRDFWAHLVQPDQAGIPRACCPGPCSGGFWRSPSRETQQPLWAACAGTLSPSQCFLMLRHNLLCLSVPTASCPGTGRWQEEPGPSLSVPSPQGSAHRVVFF